MATSTNCKDLRNDNGRATHAARITKSSTPPIFRRLASNVDCIFPCPLHPASCILTRNGFQESPLPIRSRRRASEVVSRSGKQRGYFHAEARRPAAAVHDRHPAAERDRRPAPGPRPQQHAARHPHPHEADAGLQHAVDARHRPRRHRHAGRGRAAAVRGREDKRGTTSAARGWSSASGSGRTSTKPASSASSSSWAAAATGSARGSRSTSSVPGPSARSFFHLFKDGKIYRGKRLVNWDTFLQTAVSDDEVFHETVKGHFWHFKYPVIDPKPGEPTHVTIATTRPETMLGDTAVAVHPDPAAALDKAERRAARETARSPGEREGRASKSRSTLLLDRRADDAAAARSSSATWPSAARSSSCRSPDREIPLIADEWAKPELGTGCVKITPAHDPNDYEVWQRHPEIGVDQHPEPRRHAQRQRARKIPRPENAHQGPRSRRRRHGSGRPARRRSKTAKSTSPTPTAARRRSSRTWPTSGS